MATRDWDIVTWQRASDLLQQVERIHRNFLQIAAGVQYRSSSRQKPCLGAACECGRDRRKLVGDCSPTGSRR